MPTPHFIRIREFMQKAGQETPGQPTPPSAAIRVLRAKLILEEALETVEALGVDVRVSGGGASHISLVDDPEMIFEVVREPDLEGVVDGCADISVVTIGTLVAFGVDDEPILEEVDSANLRKFAAGSYVRDDGKWMKPPDWRKPDILGVVERQTSLTSAR
jgi:predicted HAD superfamily Cof-like phosphohydrolase